MKARIRVERRVTIGSSAVETSAEVEIEEPDYTLDPLPPPPSDKRSDISKVTCELIAAVK